MVRFTLTKNQNLHILGAGAPAVPDRPTADFLVLKLVIESKCVCFLKVT